MRNTHTSTSATLGDFTAKYDLYHKDIFRFCMHKSRDHEIGQDLMQETFMRFLVCLQRKEEILNTRAFLYRIAANLFIDHVRRRKTSSLDALQEAGFEPTVDPWSHIYNRLDAERLLKKLVHKQRPYRKLLHQRFILGMPPAEIGRATGETSNAVSVRVFRGLKQLRVLTRQVA
jgi:RNA polymerase sigma-70 factor (ECF subfamily)